MVMESGLQEARDEHERVLGTMTGLYSQDTRFRHVVTLLFPFLLSVLFETDL
jgi:hypothetical protein